MKQWWIGCSGFYYKHWRDRFYPKGVPQKAWFEYYCQSFNTVELNTTFYRYPRPEALRGWYERSPARFCFTVKAPRLITHFRKFIDARRQADDFYALAGDGLREKLGFVLFQLPPNLIYSEENLERILTTLSPGFRNAIEFRHSSWWNENVVNTFQKEGIAFCGISYPGLPDDVMISIPATYYRLHGVPDLYASSYSRAFLKRVVNSIAVAGKVDEGFIYFNNDINAAALDNARTLQSLTAQ